MAKVKGINAFSAAVEASSRKTEPAEQRVAVPGDITVAQAIDDFVTHKEAEKAAEANKKLAASVFLPFAVDTYIDAALSGHQGNPRLKGKEKQCLFIIQDKTSGNIPDANVDAINALGIDAAEIVEERSEFSFDSDVMEKLSKKEMNEIGEFLGKYLAKHPGLLKVKSGRKAKKGVLDNLVTLSERQPAKIKSMIELLQYTKFPK